MSTTDVPELRWEPPPLQSNGTKHPVAFAGVREQLQARPGEWAIIRVYPLARQSSAASTASQISSPSPGRYPLMAGCEACTRTVDGEVRVYARWPEHTE